MIRDEGAHCIVAQEFGGHKVFACTVENATALLRRHQSDIPLSIRAIRDELLRDTPTVTYVSHARLQRVLKDVIDTPCGEPLMQRQRLIESWLAAEVTAPAPWTSSAELKGEVLLWLHSRGLAVTASRHELARAAQLLSELPSSLQFFADKAPLPVQFVCADEYKSAKELMIVERGCWRAEALEHRVVSRILECATEWAHRDIEYVVSEFKLQV